MELFPVSFTPYIFLLSLAIFLYLTGYLLVRIDHWLIRPLSFLLLIITGLTAHILFQDTPSFFRMLSIIWSLFLVMKIIVWNAYQAFNTFVKPNFFQWTAFALLWFGMHPAVFLKKYAPFHKKGSEMIKRGVSNLLIGSALIIISIFLKDLWGGGSYSFYSLMIITAFLLTGISFCLHFGILAINSGLWRRLGYRTYYLFRNPAVSNSLQEFWGRRWNIAFSEMSAIAIFKPLKEKIGTERAKTAAFIFSGLLHECAISLPVQAGFGLPLLYFLLHAFAQGLEKRITFRNKLVRKLWVYAWLIVPIPLLFHIYFLQEIVWPLIGLQPN